MFEEITALTEQYFKGVYEGDTTLLAGVFHPDAILSGVINGQPYYRNLPAYLEVVKNRQSPQAQGETFKMKILAVEMMGDIAFVRLHCPILGFNYYDYLSLNCIEGRWWIMHKLFTHAV